MQVVVVAFGTLLVAALTFLATRIYSQRYGVAAVSALLLFRLFGQALTALMTLAMPISLQRNVAFLLMTPTRAASAALAGLGTGAGVMAAGCSFSALFAERVAQFTGYHDGADLWRAFALLTFAQSLSTMIAMIAMARGRAMNSTVQTALVYGIAPIAPLLVMPAASLPQAIWWSASLSLLLQLPFIIEMGVWILRSGLANLRDEARGLLRYGLPRMFGNVAEFGTELAMPWLALFAGAGLEGAGYLAIGLALLRPLNPISSALNTVMIPSQAALAAANDSTKQRGRAVQATEWSFQVGLFAALQLVLWSDVIIELWLGAGFRSAIAVVRTIAASLLPVFVYQSLRGILDGEHDDPANTRNLLASLALLLAGIGALHFANLGPLGIAAAYVAAKVLLGLLTAREASRRHGLRWTDLRIHSALLAAAVLAIATVGVRYWLQGVNPMFVLLGCGLVSLIAYVWLMAKSGSTWAMYLTRRFA
jgi:O-antigen/teichoic acid export membrane protein